LAILVDTSLSMTAPGTPTPSGVPNNLTRIQEVSQLLESSSLLEDLCAKHEVTVYRFDQVSRPVALVALTKGSLKPKRDLASAGSADSASQNIDKPVENSLASESNLAELRSVAAIALVVLILGCLLILLSLLTQLVRSQSSPKVGWTLLVGSSLTLLGWLVSAWVAVPNTQFGLKQLLPFGLGSDQLETLSIPNDQQLQATKSVDPEGPKGTLPSDWSSLLSASGVESRMGDALRWVLDRELGNPLAGIVLITDGRNNAGVDPVAVLPAAQGARVPLFLVGVGTDKRPPSLQLAEVDAPRRLYPGDRFSLSCLVSSVGYEGQTVSIQFLSGKKDADLSELQLEGETTVQIPSDGSMASASIELPPKSVGSWTYAAKILPPIGNFDPRVHQMRTDVEVIQRQNRVLIFAGGPLRDYQFARNLLYRDTDVQSHVLLQSGGKATSQEAKKLIDQFPADQAALSEYDAILSFDADWTKVPDSAVQAVEKWVSQQAGGLLMVAGPVETPKWLARSASGVRSQLLRDLSPVVLDMRGSAMLSAGRTESESVWPLTITPDGRQTEFFWLTDDPTTSLEFWNSFPGVHTFYSAYELKPGAKSLALFSDPTAAAAGRSPIYVASQFYGAGRVVYHGGSEFWRLRAMGDQYFDRYFTKLVRWISQGRLLLDSDRGVLLLDREQAIQGEQVSVRAVLKNERFEPLVQSEVVARLVDPSGLNQPLVLRPLMDNSQPGVYTGQFPVLAAGVYRLQLQLGGLASQQFLKAEVQVRVPKLEMQTIERHDALLGQLAKESGGLYWKGAQSTISDDSSTGKRLVDAIIPQDQVAYTPGAPEREFQLRWLGWLMGWIAGCLSIEWLARRVHRLA
jgi:hypothetical protein